MRVGVDRDKTNNLRAPGGRLPNNIGANVTEPEHLTLLHWPQRIPFQRHIIRGYMVVRLIWVDKRDRKKTQMNLARDDTPVEWKLDDYFPSAPS